MQEGRNCLQVSKKVGKEVSNQLLKQSAPYTQLKEFASHMTEKNLLPLWTKLEGREGIHTLIL